MRVEVGTGKIAGRYNETYQGHYGIAIREAGKDLASLLTA